MRLGLWLKEKPLALGLTGFALCLQSTRQLTSHTTCLMGMHTWALAWPVACQAWELAWPLALWAMQVSGQSVPVACTQQGMHVVAWAMATLISIVFMPQTA